MRYIVKRETTGRIGRESFMRAVEHIKECGTMDEALASLRARYSLFSGPGGGGRCYGSEEDFFIVIRNAEADCIRHFWMEAEDGNGDGTVFSLGMTEEERLRRFVRRHRGHARSGSAGEWLRFIFTPTGLGTVSEVQCLSCGETEELTDSDLW